MKVWSMMHGALSSKEEDVFKVHLQMHDSASATDTDTDTDKHSINKEKEKRKRQPQAKEKERKEPGADNVQHANMQHANQ